MRKKKTDKKVQPDERKSRAIYKPSELEELIKQVNIIPKNAELRDYNEIWIQPKFQIPFDLPKEETRSFLLEKQKQIFNECFADFSEQFKENFLKVCEAAVIEEHPDYDKWNLKIASLYLAIDDYQLLYRLNTDLRSIARFFSHLRNGSYQFVSESELITNDGESIRLPAFEVQLKRDGTIGKVHKGLSEAVIGVDLDRIRTCEICEQVFWANYKNSFTCSKPCLNALRQRRHRKTNKEAINEKRRENYRQNKKVKEIREKKNGTL